MAAKLLISTLGWNGILDNQWAILSFKIRRYYISMLPGSRKAIGAAVASFWYDTVIAGSCDHLPAQQ